MTRPLARRSLAACMAALQLMPAGVIPLLWSRPAQAQTAATTKYEYDAQGNLTKVTNPNDKATVLSPDSLDRVEKVTLPPPTTTASSPVVRYTYDGLNRLLSVQDARGNTTSYVRSGLGSTVQTSPDSGRLQTDDDAAGQLSYRVNARKQSQFVVASDQLGRPKSIFYYDENTTPVKIIGRSYLTYDEYSTTAGSENYGRGHLTNVTDLGSTSNVVGSVSMRYDQLGRITRRCQFWTGPSTTGSASNCADADALRYRWGPTTGTTAGRLLGLTYPSGRLVDYQYDAQGRIKAITTTDPASSTAKAVVSNAGYTPLSVADGSYGLIYLNFGTGTSATNTPVQTYERGYNSDGRMDWFTLGEGAVSYASTYQYSYPILFDPAGRIRLLRNLKASGQIQGVSYTYDDLDRLTKATLPNGAVYNYTYDDNGNRTLSTTASISTVYSYPTSSNRLDTVKAGSEATKTLTTDATGNITLDPAAIVGGAVTYAYDGRTDVPSGRLVRSQGPGAQWDYVHNYFGQRIRKTGASYTPAGGSAIAPAPYIGSTDTLFHYDADGHLIAELDATSKQVKREYIWMGDVAVAVVAGATPTLAISGANAPALYYVHNDHLDTPRLVTDTAGKIRWSWAPMVSEPFGATAPSEAPEAQVAAQQLTLNLRFPGQYLDKETGSFYNYYRTYNPSTGRYLQSDPIGLAGGLNTYAYVGGNPIGFTDPLGLAEIPSPNGSVPGGPWTPNPSNNPGSFNGPKPPGGGPRAQCQFVPPDGEGGPPGSQGYWKTRQPGQGWGQRYDQKGNPITPEEAHPGNNVPKIPRIPFIPFILCPLCILPGAIPGSGFTGGELF
jgi:RHS repeat-associated protein